MKTTIDGTKLIVEIEIEPRQSKSGKSLIVASTNGNLATDVEYEGKRVIVGLNAYVKA